MTALAVPASALLHLAAPTSDALPTGVAHLNLPRGAISEFSGPRSSGKTSLLLSSFAEATHRGEFCAFIDTANNFDPQSAKSAGILLDHFLWVRCDFDAETALKAADLLLQGGGFGMIALDLCEVPPRILNTLPISYWFRFRRVVESTPTIFLVMSAHPLVRAAAQKTIEFQNTGTGWSGQGRGRLLESLRSQAIPRRPVQRAVAFSPKAT